MIELTTYSSTAHPFCEFDSEALDEAANLFPEISLSQVVETSATMIREFSPILLGEDPYSPSDNFFVKCLKYVVASTRALFFKTDEVRAALKAYQSSNEAFQALNQRINHLEEKINNHFDETLSLQFELELNKHLLGKSQNDQDDIIDITLDSYRAVLDAREYMGSGKDKVALTTQSRDQLCIEKGRELRIQAQQVREKAPSIDLEQRNSEIQAHLEDLLRQKTKLTEELQAIQEAVSNPLTSQLHQV